MKTPIWYTLPAPWERLSRAERVRLALLLAADVPAALADLGLAFTSAPRQALPTLRALACFADFAGADDALLDWLTGADPTCYPLLTESVQPLARAA